MIDMEQIKKDLTTIIAIRVSEAFGIDRDILFASCRIQNVVIARGVCWKLLKEYGYTSVECGAMFHKDPSTVRSILAKIDLDIEKIDYANKAWKSLNQTI